MILCMIGRILTCPAFKHMFIGIEHLFCENLLLSYFTTQWLTANLHNAVTRGVVPVSARPNTATTVVAFNRINIVAAVCLSDGQMVGVNVSYWAASSSSASCCLDVEAVGAKCPGKVQWVLPRERRLERKYGELILVLSATWIAMLLSICARFASKFALNLRQCA